MSSSSSTDSHYSWLTSQSPVDLGSPTESTSATDKEALGWIDRKHVRFCSAVGQSSMEWQDGKELGEHSLLDVDSVIPSEEENNTVNMRSIAGGIHRPLLKQNKLDVAEDGSRWEREPNVHNQDTGPHQLPGGPCEQGHIELLNPQVSNLSTGQAPGKPVHQATGPEEDGHSKGYDDDSSPLRSALKQMSSRPTSMSSSKSLENLTSQTTSEQSSKSALIRQVNRSVDDVSAIPPSAFSIVDPEPVRHDEPVADFQQEEMDSDSTSENTMAWRRNTGSSMSNISISSGMSSISGSMGSLYPVDVGDVEVQGTIQFAVNYVQKVGEFHIFVVHCHDLAVAEPKKSRSDPYVKCYLLPDITKMGKRKTSVKKKTLNPTYNEILQFKVTMEVLRTQKLNVSVWHNDTFGRNTFLGEVDVDLSRWDFSNTEMNVYTLKARVSSQLGTTSLSPATDKRGLMRVALRFLPQISQSKKTSKMETGEVQIWVKDCKNLPPVRGVIIDPFVKCTVLPDTSRKSRQKTRVVKRTTNPMFNHTMVYDGFRPEDLKEACVELTVWDHDRLNNHYIGGLRLGLGTGKSYGAEVAWMDSTTNEAYLWQRMMQSHGEWVEDVLPLRMLVMAKSMSK
ncbi:synaptotagmin-like protein 2 isoform X3 [Lampris incognitus]|uniref:synaptotagmin-like protein 2 isoform X3 n=1 Tax=Lampris incognitus TaxID=2546036 RepID=UPI0024B5CFA7|nr:synaptotagmin-like protein 2 isoform X3 [Lampris incognitus]